MTDLTAVELDDLAFTLWHDCIRPAADYTRWQPAGRWVYQGMTEYACTPILHIGGRRYTVLYATNGFYEKWMVQQEIAPGVARQYEFGDNRGQRICDTYVDWDDYEARQQEAAENAIIACEVEYPDQIQMQF